MEFYVWCHSWYDHGQLQRAEYLCDILVHPKPSRREITLLIWPKPSKCKGWLFARGIQWQCKSRRLLEALLSGHSYGFWKIQISIRYISCFIDILKNYLFVFNLPLYFFFFLPPSYLLPFLINFCLYFDAFPFFKWSLHSYFLSLYSISLPSTYFPISLLVLPLLFSFFFFIICLLLPILLFLLLFLHFLLFLLLLLLPLLLLHHLLSFPCSSPS